MPELPEVEALRLGLVKFLVGQKITRVEVREPKLVSGQGNVRQASAEKTRAFIRGLTDKKIVAINRRAKNLILKLAPDGTMLVHLKMTGQLIYREHDKNKVVGGHPIEISEETLPNKHSHIIFTLDRGTLYYNDTRKFGYLLFYPNQKEFERKNHFQKIGLEPFDNQFTSEYLHKSLKNGKKILKTALMDQGIVTGLGNIYCDEVCFVAGVQPIRKTASLSTLESHRIYSAIKKILPRAIKLGGSSIVNYRLADGSRGNYAREHKVYGRGGEKCFRCSQILTITKINNRTTVYCKKCQK